MSHLDPIAYTYEADTHCPACAKARFGRSEAGFIAEDCEDSEGNPVGVIAPWDEVDPAAGLYCGTCGQEIVEAHPYVVIESSPGYLPEDDDPRTFSEYADAVEYLNDRAAEYADDPDANYRVEYGIASADNYAAVIVWDDDKTHDLGRVIEILRNDS